MTASPTGTPVPRTARSAALGLAALALLVFTTVSAIYVGDRTAAQFRAIGSGWSDYAEDAAPRGVWISAIRDHLGYGGIIHHFKNYVLRQEAVYLESTRRQIEAFERVVAEYLAHPLPEEERAALLTIAETIRAYAAMLPVAERAAAEGWEVTQTDAAVRIDDRPALAAFATLETLWQERRKQSTSQMLGAVEAGRALMGRAFGVLATVVLAGGLLTALTILALRDLRGAAVRLDRELTERRRLARSERRLAMAVEQSPAAIFVADTRGRLLYVNRRFEQITGWTSAAILGHTPAMLRESGAGPDLRTMKATLRAGDTWRGMLRCRRADGTTFWADVAILPLIEDDGSTEAIICIAEDITDRRAARAQLVRAQKLEVVGQLAGGIAHDFNNILSTIVGSAHLAALDAPDGSDLAAEIAQIDIAARRAQTLVQELLTFARRGPRRPKPTAVTALVEEVVRLIRASVPPNVRFEVDAPGPIAIMADPDHLHQVLMNLCRNAAEALGPDGGRVLVRVAHGPRVEDAPEQVRISVADDGPGMAAETLEHIFQPFYTTKPVGKGSGLGLAVVAGLVAEMGGTVEVASTPGAGSVFTLTLPAATDDLPAITEANDPLPRGRERVLVVDDQAEVAGVLQRMLARLGYRVEAFTEPRRALARLEADPRGIDLLLTDLVMPDLDGNALARAARQLRPDLPVVICTAYAPQMPSLPGPEPEVLSKPITPDRLARALRSALDGVSGRVKKAN